MAGIPPFFGFVAKEAAIESALHADPLHGMPGVFTTAGIVVGSILTVAYSLYLLYGAFATKPSTHATGGGTSECVKAMHKVTVPLIAPAWILAVAGLVTGIFPQGYDRIIAPYLSSAFPAADAKEHLALWHGFSLTLALTAAIIAIGVILHWQRKLVRQLNFDKPALGDANKLYDGILDLARRLSLRATASTQRGSLPLNEAVILGVLIVLPLASLLLGAHNDLRMELWGSAPEGAAALLIIIAALAATRLRNRLSGVIMVGVTGYSLSIIFVLWGAPDLALTQLLVETVVMVIFVLVLRTLPSRALNIGNADPRYRAWLAIGVGIAVTVLGAYAMASRTVPSIAEELPALAKDIGHGANTVNVLLVDIRAWDTFGEISVLVIVAVGIASLVFRSHTQRAYPQSKKSVRGQRRKARWLVSTEDAENENLAHPIMVMVAARLLFPSMLILGVYLFFAGHNAPGGGFAGGLVVALALAMRYIAGGRKELAVTVPIATEKILGTGLLLAAIAAAWPLLLKWPPLSSWYFSADLPVLGKVSIVSPMLLDLGVFLIVIGTVIYILRSLGGRIDIETARRAGRSRSRRMTLTTMGRTRNVRRTTAADKADKKEA